MRTYLLFILLLISTSCWSQINISLTSGFDFVNIRSNNDRVSVIDNWQPRPISTLGLKGTIPYRDKLDIVLSAKYYFTSDVDILDIRFVLIPITNYQFKFIRNGLGLTYTPHRSLSIGIESNLNVFFDIKTYTLSQSQEIADSPKFEYGGTVLLAYNYKSIFIELNYYYGVGFIENDNISSISHGFAKFAEPIESIGISFGFRF